MKTDLFQSCGHCWVFQICWHIECSSFTASSFRIWNSSTLLHINTYVQAVHTQLTSHVQFFVTLWTVAHQAPLSMGFSRQEYWSGLSHPPPGDLPDPGVKPVSLMSPALAGRFFTTGATWEEPWIVLDSRAKKKKKEGSYNSQHLATGWRLFLESGRKPNWDRTVLLDLFNHFIPSFSPGGSGGSARNIFDSESTSNLYQESGLTSGEENHSFLRSHHSSELS